jgi:hypothetical protein
VTSQAIGEDLGCIAAATPAPMMQCVNSLSGAAGGRRIEYLTLLTARVADSPEGSLERGTARRLEAGSRETPAAVLRRQ